MMKRIEALKIIDRHVTDEIVVATYSSAHDWIAINHRPLNYYSFGAMGLASSHALGMALAMPQRRVVVLDGDGSLLMNLGTLVTIAAAGPKNLVHFVCKNDTYEANGGHPIVNQSVDFVGIAKAAGISAVHSISDLTQLERQIADVLKAEGPVFCVLNVEQGAIVPREYEDMYSSRRRQALRMALTESA